MKNLYLKTHSYKALLIAFKAWLDVLGYAETTVYNLPIHLKEFFYYLEEINIYQLNYIQIHHVKNYYQYLKERPNQRRNGALSNGSLNKHQQALLKFQEYLKEHQTNFIFPVHLKQERSNQKNSLNVLTQQEIKQLFEATNYSYQTEKLQYRDKAMLVCLYSCGMRRNEVVHLNIEDVLFDKQRIFISQGKNYKERFVPINKHSLQILETYIFDYRTEFYNPNKNEALFLNYRGNRLLGKSFANNLERLIKATGNSDLNERNITLHSLRHSIATHLLEQGADIEHISTFLGHASLESTQIYTHFLEHTADDKVHNLLREKRLFNQSYSNLSKKRTTF